ncbi:MAG: PQQ-dependent sugar dehydrogenase [Phycisphaeraceae bacterium]|nr:PQQ-dependent sugar dehydrogenase [Phycisphaeraceae bacterium]
MLHRPALIAVAVFATTTAFTTAMAQTPPAVATTNIVGTGLNRPVGLAHAPGDKCRLFVIEKQGLIKIIDISGGTPSVTGTFLNIDAKIINPTSNGDERGLLGLAFHPDYWTNGYFFVNYINNSGNTVIERYQVSADPNVANAASGLIVMTISQPFSNHNGGWIDFGPDGKLYIATGDGGSGNDPNNAGQNLNTRLGKILRIEPNVAGSSPPFFVPSDNPLVSVPGDSTIWHWGLRNPWRNSFDRLTGDLWIADVGQGAREEINFAPEGVPGLNFGWRCMEGFLCTGLTGCTCNAPSLTKPIRDYPHTSGPSGGFSVTGGYVYRGPAMPGLQGYYFHSDYQVANTWRMLYDPVSGTISNLANINAQVNTSLQGTAVNTIASYGEDARGELYLVKQGSTTAGGVFKIIPQSGEVVWNPGDLNHDGVVDGADLAIVLGSWGSIGGDTNCDFTTDGSDIANVLGNWTP